MGRLLSFKRIKVWLANRRIEAAAAPRLDALMRHIEGRSVAIVGNAASLLATAQGPLIDSHQIVLRMNRGFPVDALAQGARLDVWCFSTIGMVRQAPAGLSVAHAAWMSPKRRDEYDGVPPCCFYPLARWRDLRRGLGARPSVGAMTIDLVSAAAPGSVSIFGFDFKRSPTFYSNSRHAGAHDYGAESRYVLAMAERPGWRFVAPDESV